MVKVPCVVVMLAAKEELFVFTLEPIVVTLTDNDEDVVVAVLFVVVILAANDELLVLIMLDNPSIRRAALEEFVVTVPLSVDTVEFIDITELFSEPEAE